MSTRHDDDRDAHLRAALRHAPDHDAMPPAALSEQILAVARRSVQQAPDQVSWVRRVRDALSSTLDALTRPASAAAFASLVLATVIGVMWREGAPPEALPERARGSGGPPTQSKVPPPAPAPAAPAPATAESLSRPANEAPLSDRAQHGIGAQKPAAEPKRRVTPANSSDAPRADRSKVAQPLSATPASAEGARPSVTTRQEARKATTATAVAADPALPAPAQTPTQASPPATATGRVAAQTPAAAPPAPAEAAALPAAPAAAATPTPAPPAPSPAAGRALPRSAPLAAAAPAPRSSLDSTARDPLADVLLELGREASSPSAPKHRWQRGNAVVLPHGPTAQAWLAELQQATQGAWHAQGATPAGAQALVLSNEGGVVARLELIDAGVLWHSASAPNVSWRAALSDESLKRLRESLAAWAGR